MDGLASSQCSAGGKTSRQINKQYGGARIKFIYTSLFFCFPVIIQAEATKRHWWELGWGGWCLTANTRETAET